MNSTAMINHKSPRAAAWREVFGFESIPILSPVPHLGTAPGLGVRRFYSIDLDALSQKVRNRLVAYLSGKFNAPEDIVWQELNEKGCPILADDVMVAFDSRLVF